MSVSALKPHPAVDVERFSLRSSSFAGGHAFVLSATETRIKSVVSLVPTISGDKQARRRVAPGQVLNVEDRSITYGRRRRWGGVAGTQLVVSTGDASRAIYC